MICPLCLGSHHIRFDQDKLRTYEKCQVCNLVFVPRAELVSPSIEKNRYDAHENDETDEGYSQYLQNISIELKKHINPSDLGLDFGCGRSTLLAKHLLPSKVDSYDLFFHPDPTLLKRTYDFIVLSEVIEHLRDPREEMIHLAGLTNKIFIKTKFYPETGFAHWFYKRDITHVQFFNDESFETLMKICGFLEFKEIGKDLYLFKK